MSYTEHIKYDELCNYLDSSKDNAEKMLRSCINKTNNSKNPGKRGSSNGTQVIEGFASDMGIDTGVSYIPPGECPVGHTNKNGECLQVCSHCKYNDKNGFFGDNITLQEEICGGPGLFYGVDKNGFIQCIPEKGATDNNLTNSITHTYNVDSSFTKKRNSIVKNILFI